MRSVVLALAVLFAPAIASAVQYNRVAVVEKDTGEYRSPNEAMDRLAEWCPEPIATNAQCLLRIMPGSYPLTNGRLAMRSHVDIEGSGVDATTLVGTVDAAGASSVELRSLAIEQNSSWWENPGFSCFWTTTNAVRVTDVAIRTVGTNGMVVSNNCFLTLDRVTVNASRAAGTGDISALYHFHFTKSVMGTLTITNSSLSATGGTRTLTVFLWDGGSPGSTQVNILRSAISATGASQSNTGVWNGGAANLALTDDVITTTGTGVLTQLDSGNNSAITRISGSEILGPTSIAALQQSYTYVAHSRLGGTISVQYPGYGYLKCIGNYDTFLNPVSCP